MLPLRLHNDRAADPSLTSLAQSLPPPICQGNDSFNGTYALRLILDVFGGPPILAGLNYHAIERPLRRKSTTIAKRIARPGPDKIGNRDTNSTSLVEASPDEGSRNIIAA